MHPQVKILPLILVPVLSSIAVVGEIFSTRTKSSGSGLAGAFLTLVQLGSFSDSVTSGRGFIALALVVFGRRNPLGILVGSLFIGMVNAMQFKLQIFIIGLPAQYRVHARTERSGALGRYFDERGNFSKAFR